MAPCNMIATMPDEILSLIFLILSECALDISACRLTCRKFHQIISSFFVTSVAVPTDLRNIHKLLDVLENPAIFQHVKQVIYIETFCEWYDKDKYDEAFECADWDQMEDEDKTLWRALSNFSGYLNQGPEKFRLVIQGVSTTSSLPEPEFAEYLSSIRLNVLERLLKNTPKLQNISLLDYCSACMEGLFQYNLEDMYYEKRPMWPWHSYDCGADFHRLIHLLGDTNVERLKALSVGPYSFGKCVKFWEDHRDKNVTVRGREMSHHLRLDSLDYAWSTELDKDGSVLRGLRELHLPFVVEEYASLESVENTSLPQIVELAAPTLTHLILDAKGLILDDDFPTKVSLRGILGRLAFDKFFGTLTFPHLVQFSLRGWLYTQDDMQCFLTRHAQTLRKLSLVDNVMVQRQLTTLSLFIREEMLLSSLEIRDRLSENGARRETDDDEGSISESNETSEAIETPV